MNSYKQYPMTVATKFISTIIRFCNLPVCFDLEKLPNGALNDVV